MHDESCCGKTCRAMRLLAWRRFWDFGGRRDREVDPTEWNGGWTIIATLSGGVIESRRMGALSAQIPVPIIKRSWSGGNLLMLCLEKDQRHMCF